MIYELEPLPYAYDALEPYIDARTMEIHHTKHHQGYIDKLNAALKERGDLADQPLEDLLKGYKTIPQEVRQTIINNGGGHYNHSFFWVSMSPEGGGEPKGDLGDALRGAFNGFENFKKEFTEAALNRFGSGWVWLVLDGGTLKVMSTPNQDSPLMEKKIPLLGLDVWEHAYYLQYQNRRAEYVEAWWNIVDWKRAMLRFAQK